MCCRPQTHEINSDEGTDMGKEDERGGFYYFCPFASSAGYESTEFWQTIVISSDLATSIYIISYTAVMDDRF